MLKAHVYVYLALYIGLYMFFVRMWTWDLGTRTKIPYSTLKILFRVNIYLALYIGLYVFYVRMWAWDLGTAPWAVHQPMEIGWSDRWWSDSCCICIFWEVVKCIVVHHILVLLLLLFVLTRFLSCVFCSGQAKNFSLMTFVCIF